jgi:hypothetical protein
MVTNEVQGQKIFDAVDDIVRCSFVTVDLHV